MSTNRGEDTHQGEERDQGEETDQGEEREKPRMLISPKELYKREVIAIIVISVVISIIGSIIGSIITSAVVLHIYNASTEPAMAEHSHNITDLHLDDPSHQGDDDRLLRLEEMLHNATARIAELEAIENQSMISRLQVRMGKLEKAISALEANKACQEQVDNLTNSIAICIAKLNDSSEFNDIVDNVSELANTVMELGEELKDLVKTALNHTHYDQLQDGIDRLESSKASQTQFEELVSNFTSLANTTVGTGEFILLYKRLEEVENTTEDLTTKVTTLQDDIEWINVTLTMIANQHKDMISELQVQVVQLETETRELEASKASQDEVDQLFDSIGLSIALLNDSKVDVSEFVATVGELSSTKADTATVMELGVQLHDLTETALNHTHYDQLQDGIDRLESTKASKTQFEELVSNFTSLANTTVGTGEFILLSKRLEEVENTTEDLTTKVTTLQDDIEWINVTLTTKASQDMVSELQVQVGQLKTETRELEASKASQDEVDQLFDSIGLSIVLLNDSKVDNSVFNDFIDTVSKLVSTKADTATVMELGEELKDLATTSLNHTHYDQLQDGIDRLESSKASQTQFEELVSNFTSLANTTVRTSEFLLLSKRVEEVENTTVKEDKFFDIVMKVTTLEGDVKHINITLDMKADQQDVNDAITTLTETTVKRDEFVTTVETIQTSKANQSDLVDLETKVSSLGQTTVKKREFDLLNETVTRNITSLQTAHERDIKNLTDQTRIIEGDIKELKKSASSRPLASTWVITAMAIVVILSYKCM